MQSVYNPSDLIKGGSDPLLYGSLDSCLPETAGVRTFDPGGSMMAPDAFTDMKITIYDKQSIDWLSKTSKDCCSKIQPKSTKMIRGERRFGVTSFVSISTIRRATAQSLSAKNFSIVTHLGLLTATRRLTSNTYD